MSGDAERGPKVPTYIRAEIRSCDRQSIRNEDGTDTPYLALRGFNMKNEPVRIIMRGKPGERHEDGELGDVLRQFPSSAGGETMAVRYVARVMGSLRQAKTPYYDAREIVRLNGPGAEFVLARRDGVMALDMAARLHAAGDPDAAYRLLEDRVAQMCGVPAPSVVHEAELSGRHPGPDPEGPGDEGVVAPGEDAEDRARRIYRSVDRGLGRAPPVAAEERQAPRADSASPAPTEGLTAETPASPVADAGTVVTPEVHGADASVAEAVAVQPVAMPIHGGADTEAEATSDVDPDAATPTAPVADAAVVDGNGPSAGANDDGERAGADIVANESSSAPDAVEAKPAEPVADVSDAVEAKSAEPVADVPDAVETKLAEPVADVPDAVETKLAEPVADVPDAVETKLAEPVADVPDAVEANSAEPVADVPDAVEANSAEPVADVPDAVEAKSAEPVADVPDAVEAKPAEPVADVPDAVEAKPAEPAKPAAGVPAMPGFRSRARMGVPSVAPAVSQPSTTQATRPPAGASPPVSTSGKPQPEAARGQPEAARPVPASAMGAAQPVGRPPGRPRMGMGRPLPPAVQPLPEPEDEPTPSVPGM